MICWRWCRNWLSEEGFDQRPEQFLKCFFGKSVSPYCHRAGCQRSCWRRLAHRSRRESQETPPRDHPAGEALQKNNAGGRCPNCTGALNFKPGSLRKSSWSLKIKRRGLNWKGQNPPCGQKVTPQKSIIRRVHNYSMIITKIATVQNILWDVVWWWWY